MEKIQLPEGSQGISSVTTDAVHRRVRKKSKLTAMKEENSEENEYYPCKQCDQKMSASLGKEDLNFHFENTNHRSFATCSEPVFSVSVSQKRNRFNYECNLV